MEEMTPSLAVIAERLGKSELFQSLPEKDLLEIAKFCHEEVFQDGQEIFIEGEPADRIIVVERGKLAIEKKIQLGRHSTPRNATIAYVNPDQIANFCTWFVTKAENNLLVLYRDRVECIHSYDYRYRGVSYLDRIYMFKHRIKLTTDNPDGRCNQGVCNSLAY